jgi:hypothetical protein
LETVAPFVLAYYSRLALLDWWINGLKRAQGITLTMLSVKQFAVGSLERSRQMFFGSRSQFLIRVGVAVIALFAIAIATTAVEAECPAPSVRDCRADGGLKFNGKAWTTACGPNTMLAGHDPICQDIAQCQAAGGFGKFLQGVTENCRAKSFDGYFGLDGITFGILDFTANNLPALFEIYDQQSPDKFKQIFGDLHLPMTGECVDPHWVCQQNRAGFFNCDPKFHTAFERSVRDPELQKTQLKLALRQYTERINHIRQLGLKTEYGLVSLAVVKNNLKDGEKHPECSPTKWKQQCQNRGSEAEVVDCMMQKYVDGTCRGNDKPGSDRGTRNRFKSIEDTFRNHKDDPYREPSPSAIEGCSTRWGQTSGRVPR